MKIHLLVEGMCHCGKVPNDKIKVSTDKSKVTCKVCLGKHVEYVTGRQKKGYKFGRNINGFIDRSIIIEEY